MTALRASALVTAAVFGFVLGMICAIVEIGAFGIAGAELATVAAFAFGAGAAVGAALFRGRPIR